MTILAQKPTITGVQFRGLEDLLLPFTSHYWDDPSLPGLPEGQAENDDKYYIKNVTGLEPPTRNVAISRTASGGKFQGVTVEDREVVVLLGLNPDYEAGETPQFLRDNLYTLLYTGYDPKVDIHLMNGITPLAREYAYVTAFEEALFDANPAVQITLTCLNPTFRAFFPHSYAPDELSETYPDVYNFGTAETGFQFAVKFTDDMNGWYIKTAEDQNVGMVFDMLFHENDVLSVSTIPGQKYVHWKKHRGKVQNKIGILKNNAEWIQLHPGHNHFVVPAKLAKWEWNGSLTFTPRYAGV